MASETTQSIRALAGSPGDRPIFYGALFVGAILMLAITFVVSTFWIKVLWAMYMYITFASAWNYLSGYTGYPTFGPILFIGIGAYSTVFFTVHAGMVWYVALLGSAAVSVVAALVFGYILLRLDGLYFAIGTLLFAEAVHEAVLIEGEILGGAAGINLPPISLTETYLLFGALALLSVAITYETATRTFGLRMLAIREDEGALEAVGVNPLKYKLSAFTIHGLLTALAGGLFALNLGFVFPDTVFSIDITVTLILIAILGGIGTVWGPVIGALVIIPIRELLTLQFPALNTILFGLFLVGAIILMPEGIIEKLKEYNLLPRDRGI